MRKIAAFRMRRQPEVPTLQPTALVNEAVLRLIQMLNNQNAGFPETREHFMALISRMMRFTLTDYARKKKLKTDSLDDRSHSSGDSFDERLPEALQDWSDRDVDDLLTIDQALTALERSDPDYGKRRSAAIELYLFGGLNYREIAEELGVTDDMARRDCLIALGRLREALGGQAGDRNFSTSR
jgi:RNA polymerase sigma factor (sigma-70 family)